jgi:prenyl protein peptidase
LFSVFRFLSEFSGEDPLFLFRNLVFAPFTEELVFRSVIVLSLYLSYHSNDSSSSSFSAVPVSSLSLAAESTLFFGIAHIHHCYEKIRNGENISRAFISTFIQFVYTSIFGMIAALFLIRTGSLWSAVLSHMICNLNGLPNLGFFSSRNNQYAIFYPYRYLICVLYVGALIAFGFFLFPFTNSFVSIFKK